METIGDIGYYGRGIRRGTKPEKNGNELKHQRMRSKERGKIMSTGCCEPALDAITDSFPRM